jgi:hypothetical protein
MMSLIGVSCGPKRFEADDANHATTDTCFRALSEIIGAFSNVILPKEARSDVG